MWGAQCWPHVWCGDARRGPAYVTPPPVYCREKPHDVHLRAETILLQTDASACWQVLTARLWAFAPNFSSQELSPKALKCNTSPCCLLQASHWSAEASDWPILWPGNVQAQCSAAHFILKGYQSYQNKSSQKLIKICCSLNGVTASQLSDHFWF